MSFYFKKLLVLILLLFLLKRTDIALGEEPYAVVRDYRYSRWVPHYFAVSTILSNENVANRLLKNPEERFDARSFIQLYHLMVKPAIFIVMGKN